MDNELFFVLRAVKTDNIGLLAGYDDVVERARRDGQLMGFGTQVRVTGPADVELFDETCRRMEAGLDVDRDPRALSSQSSGKSMTL